MCFVQVFDTGVQYMCLIQVFDVGVQHRCLIHVFDTGVEYRRFIAWVAHHTIVVETGGGSL